MIVLIFMVALLIRVYFPYDLVFDDSVRFIGNDAYYHMRIIDSLVYNYDYPNIIDPYFSLYPVQMTFNVFHYGIAGIILLFTGFNPDVSSVNYIGAFMPALIGSFTVIPMYFLGKAIFDSKVVGYVAAGLLAIIPGEFLSRTLLGFADYHGFEVLLTTTFMLFVVLFIKSDGWTKRVVYFICTCTVFMMYYYTWIGSLLFLGIVALMVLIWLAINLPLRFMIPMLAMGVILLVGLVVFNTDVFNVAFNKVLALWPTGERLMITEAHNLTLPIAWSNFTTMVIIAPIGFGIVCYLAYKYREADKILLIVWALVLFIITLFMRRFTYYLAVPVCLLSAYAIYLLIKQNWRVALACCAVFVIFPCLVMSVRLANNPVHMINDDWQDALVWVRDNTDELEWGYYDNYNFKYEPFPDYYRLNNYTILSHWDYGYWITRVGQRSPVSHPGTDFRRATTATLLASDDLTEIKQMVNILGTKYIILNKDMFKYKWYSVQQWGNSEAEKEDTISYKLFNGEQVNGYSEVYRNDSLAIFEVVQ